MSRCSTFLTLTYYGVNIGKIDGNEKSIAGKENLKLVYTQE